MALECRSDFHRDCLCCKSSTLAAAKQAQHEGADRHWRQPLGSNVSGEVDVLPYEFDQLLLPQVFKQAVTNASPARRQQACPGRLTSSLMGAG